jgi:glutamine synthetase
MSLENVQQVLYNQYSHRLADVDQNGSIIAEYIWLDGSGLELRAKCRTLPGKVTSVD